MADVSDVYKAADLLLKERKPVSVRAVRELLTNGGSLEDITPMVRRWKRDRNYLGMLSTTDISEALAKALYRQVQATRMAVRKDAEEHALERETLALQRQISAQVGQLGEALTETAAAVAGVVRRFDKGPWKPDGGRARGVGNRTVRYFWDALMQEIADILADGGMTAAEIAEKIDPQTRSFAAHLGYTLDAAKIEDALRIRVAHRNYFRREGERFHNLEGGTRAAG